MIKDVAGVKEAKGNQEKLKRITDQRKREVYLLAV
jgi:dihydrodipicolinate synthase/N-acetylneuraminate lyase